ncbi:hypothetical protein AUH73_08800 [archaeon 13_1_40CM_4_53_4]|nr:MAG: hypothetical protein AUH73_08800 [archaeon 13_1_40CM_4_53_4]OLE58308.1 MAG: hypothetical protein AUG17_08150 [Crenarchaeota archaeon 13_1_20CM_2_53_14]TMI24004.1 MAG: DUF4287 domain-containing protein [Candidatus Bathyarchaeota archaeon]
MARPTFKAYAENIEAKSGKTLEDFWRLANRKGFVKRGHVVAKHGEMLAWFKSDMRLGHVHANFIILFLRLRANDQKVSAQAREWAFATGFQKSE